MFPFSTGKILESLILIVTNVFGKSLYNSIVIVFGRKREKTKISYNNALYICTILQI